MTLRDSWETNALAWARWAISPTLDFEYRQINRPQFLELLPPPGRLSLDIACGEGRLPRELAALGHRVVGIDASPTLIRVAQGRGGGVRYVRGDATRLPFPDGVVDLAIAFFCLHDIEDLQTVIGEAARVLMPGGRFCIAIQHPTLSVRSAAGSDVSNAFESYFDSRPYAFTIEREGQRMTFHSIHRPLAAYFGALEEAGLLVEALREPVPPDPTWPRIPVFLYIRAVRA